jgi:dienelactone hydrolase
MTPFRKSTHQARQVFSRVVWALLLIFLVVTPILLFPPHRRQEPTGAYAVASVRYTYSDESRIETYTDTGENRRVNLTCWHPAHAAGETYPLVVFSHGGLGTENSNESLYRELASHGYVVCSIGHPYHAFWTKGEDGQITFVSQEYFGELQREDAKTDKPQSYRYYQKWLEIRTSDINFVIDTILAKAAGGAGGVYALVDGTKIGVIGHSLGGSAALAMPRQREDIAAVIALESPFLYDIVGVENDAFLWLDAAYPVPVLNIYSDSSWSHLATWPQYARNANILSDAPETAVSLHLSGAGHFSLTDLALVSPLLTRLLEGGQPNQDPEGYLQAVNQVCLEFFDHYLKNPDQTIEINP